MKRLAISGCLYVDDECPTPEAIIRLSIRLKQIAQGIKTEGDRDWEGTIRFLKENEDEFGHPV